MTVEEVNDAIAAIKKHDGDDEVQHIREDNLHREVLQAIAVGAQNGQELAVAALKTMNLGFSRWCA